MANINDVRKAAMAKAKARPSRPSMQRMAQIKSSGSGTRAKSATPKVVGKKATKNTAPSTDPASVSKTTQAAKPKKTRHRSASGSAARGLIAGRHPPKNRRYKTGHWRLVRQPWMTNEVWEAYKALNRFKNKGMSRGLKKASKGKEIFGKEGPGHAGYGTGKLQMWADKILKAADGTDPHFVDMTKWFAGVASALDYHNGERDFKQLMKEQKGDPNHFMRKVLEAIKDMVPALKKLSKRGLEDIMRHKFYTAQYGPDGRAK